MRRRALLLGAVGVGGAAAVAAVTSGGGTAAVVLAAGAGGAQTATGTGSCLDGLSTGALPQLDGQQTQVARTIDAVARQSGVGAAGAIVGIATAQQESGLRELPHGDRDSIGPFQQRAGWGPPDERLHAESSARLFFTGGRGGQRGLRDVPGWQLMPVWQAAQTVQVSAFPTAYARWVDLATATVRSIEGSPAPVPAECTPPVLSAQGWVLPVARGAYRLSSGFGPRASPGGIGSTFHEGLDFAAPIGTSARAAAAGTVTATRPEASSGGFGNLVVVDNGGGIQTYYAHLSAFSTSVGQHLRAGAEVGKVGSTGHSTGPHLHFQVDRQGVPIDPMPFLRARGVQP